MTRVEFGHEFCPSHSSTIKIKYLKTNYLAHTNLHYIYLLWFFAPWARGHRSRLNYKLTTILRGQSVPPSRLRPSCLDNDLNCIFLI
jgi:hypothetical protein